MNTTFLRTALFGCMALGLVMQSNAASMITISKNGNSKKAKITYKPSKITSSTAQKPTKPAQKRCPECR